jgi:polyisoprenoid-binding protein YceI
MPWQFDPTLSQVQWEVQYLGIAAVRGFFNTWQANVDLDGDDPTRWSVDATIDVASIDSGVPDRDKHLRSPDYFDVERFPTITFKSTRAERDGEAYKVYGDLTMYGTTREVMLHTRIGGEATDPRGRYRRGFTGKTALKRGDYGMPTSGASSNEVQIVIDLQAIRTE